MIFRGRKLLIATMHGKERVIAPIFQHQLGVITTTCSNFNTDQFGTFSGEIERTEDALTTVRRKCLAAMASANCDMGVASEGSFGPHPQVFFTAVNEEILIFIDQKYGLEVAVKEISTKTNFAAKQVWTWEELMAFAKAVQFPSHALILQRAEKNFLDLQKGISDWETLATAYAQLQNADGSVYASTDMRAMYNPTRMAVIEKAASQLAERMNTQCPGCSAHGFGLSGSKAGLPCQWCGLPTRATLAHIHSCKNCGYVNEILYPHGKLTEEPTFCDFCNP